jgi:predicted nucleic acid-binding protein
VIVADTNVLAYLHLPGDRTAEAEAVYAWDPDWIVPPLWRSEFRNVLATHLRRGELGAEAAIEVCERAEALLASREHSVSSARVLRLSASSGCSAYDCEFIGLAMAMDAMVVTSDRSVLAAFPRRTMSLAAFAEK